MCCETETEGRGRGGGGKEREGDLGKDEEREREREGGRGSGNRDEQRERVDPCLAHSQLFSVACERRKINYWSLWTRDEARKVYHQLLLLLLFHFL